MRITQEADYALRIVYYLGNKDNIIDAKTISEAICVPLRFSLKILRKLVMGGVIKSFKGVNGGYKLSICPKNITMKNIVELIEGPITISRCLSDDFDCSNNDNNKQNCVYHHIFNKINDMISQKLNSITLEMIICNNCKLDEILDLI